MATPLLLYLFDEASSGTAPTDVHDTSPGTALDMPITYGGTGAAWTSIAAGDGFDYTATPASLIRTATLGSTKVTTALAGTYKATLEVVLRGNTAVDFVNVHTIFGIENLSFTLSLLGGTLQAFWNNGNTELGYFNTLQDFWDGNVYVIHVAVDMTQALEADRCQYYVNGVLATRDFGGGSTQNEAIDASGSLNATRVDAGVDCESLELFYCALYADWLDATTITANATALLADNDAVPAGDPPVITVQPADQTVLLGSTATFNVTATGTGTLHYQWKDDGSNVGTDSSSYTTAASTLSDNGAIITVDVTDDNGTTVSSNAHWYVINVATLAWFRF